MTFVDGIGPPLEQLWEDYSEGSTEARDIHALIAEVWRLRRIEDAARAYLWQQNGFEGYTLEIALSLKAPCLFPIADDIRCCECATCQPRDRERSAALGKFVRSAEGRGVSRDAASLVEGRRIADAALRDTGSSPPLSAEREGALSAKDNPSATDDGSREADLTDRQPGSELRRYADGVVQALEGLLAEQVDPLGYATAEEALDRAREVLSLPHTPEDTP